MSDERPQDDTPDDEHREPEVVSGEVVGEPTRARAVAGPPKLASIVGAGAAVLLLNGLLFTLVALPPSLDIDAARCTTARTEIEAANDNDEDYDDVQLDVDDVDDLACDDAVALAEQIPLEDPADVEEGDEVDTVWIPSTGELRFQLTAILAFGFAQVTGGVLVLVRGRRWMRNVSVAAAALGLVFPVFGLASMVAAAFVVYALVFSRQSKELWPR
ncbi:hypothetical protein [Actinomarinicola tropica]|uniref:Uncharacterized protein n=1 Tax=Actinomarinicola tropica TaxID=2789776 RepID=A0A5Q2RJP5_9ACTN|nr:hypothetical protein [Actinomarinicola tropica]QGG94616.1 hypothetical protein GH723_05560 [Actinomarinicola tropica]